MPRVLFGIITQQLKFREWFEGKLLDLEFKIQKFAVCHILLLLCYQNIGY